MSKFTQDEWAVNSASRMEVNSFKGIAIADCSMSQMINTEEKAANSKLIAAAPDLLKSLKMMLSQFEYDGATEFECQCFWDAKQAIKKAEGQQ